MTTSRPTLRIVLVRPKIAGNIGSVARILANTGLRDLVIVAPPIDPKGAMSRKQAARAIDILEAARVVDRLEDALDGVAFTVAASCRPGMYRRQTRRNPRQLASEARARLGVTAVVFGPEDHGLSNEDVLMCDATVRIETHADYASLNLSHAVMVIAYEWFVAEASVVARASPPVRTPAPEAERAPADGVMMARLMDKFRDSLGRIGYLNPQNPDHLLMALRSLLARARPTTQEVKILMGLAQQIRKFADHGQPHYPDRPKPPSTPPTDP